jgi:hypothetical protein
MTSAGQTSRPVAADCRVARVNCSKARGRTWSSSSPRRRSWSNAGRKRGQGFFRSIGQFITLSPLYYPYIQYPLGGIKKSAINGGFLLSRINILLRRIGSLPPPFTTGRKFERFSRRSRKTYQFRLASKSPLTKVPEKAGLFCIGYAMIIGNSQPRW